MAHSGLLQKTPTGSFVVNNAPLGFGEIGTEGGLVRFDQSFPQENLGTFFPLAVEFDGLVENSTFTVCGDVGRGTVLHMFIAHAAYKVGLVVHLLGSGLEVFPELDEELCMSAIRLLLAQE